MMYESKKPKDEEKSGKENRNTNEDINEFIFPISSIDVVLFDNSYFLYTSSPIPDFIMT
jgi:hypothetical protein